MSRATTAPGRAREYETIYVLKPEVDADAAEKVGNRVAECVLKGDGKLTKVELWGRRRLAYDVAKCRRGVYVYLKYFGNGAVVGEMERNLRLSDDVLKYQTVLLRNDVPTDDIAVGEEDIKFERLELTPIEDERDESRERQLGLVEPERRERHDDYRDRDRDRDGDGPASMRGKSEDDAKGDASKDDGKADAKDDGKADATKDDAAAAEGAKSATKADGEESKS